MKKIALMFVFVAFSMMAAFSQDDGFRFGIHASPGITWLANNSDSEAVVSDGTSFGFKFGGIGELYFRENYAIKFGVGMSLAQGGNLVFNTINSAIDTAGVVLFADSQPDIRTNSDSPKVKFRYQYIEVPIGLKMRTNEMGSFRYYAEIPILTIGVNIAARGEIDGVEGGDFKIAKDTGLFQISWGLGGGAEYAISETVSLTAGLFFQSGMANTYFSKTNKEEIDESKTILNGIDIRFGVMF